MATAPFLIRTAPGCKRDGTLLEGDNYVDNQWCRYQFAKGLPRKMGGYKRLTNQLSGIVRGMIPFEQNGFTYIHTGEASKLEQFTLDMNGNASGISDRTPVGFTTSANNLWQFDTLFDGTGVSTTQLLAHAAPNLNDISSNTTAPVYYGPVTTAAALVASGSPSVSGGVMAVGPFGVSYGSNGGINVSAANDPLTAWPNTYRPSSQKIVFGLPIRGGAGNGPSALLWGLDHLLRMTFVGGTAIWNFDTLTAQYSILSQQGVVEYDGVYYWPGVDRFMMFNGVVQEIPNDMNQNWFFDNLNFAAANKVFALKMPRWGEIWWCYPRGNATECTHAVILNVKLSRLAGFTVWYDTKLPNSGRSCGQYAQVFRSPLMTGVDVDSSTAGYKLWQHEAPGVVDELDGPNVRAIQSYFETNAMFPNEIMGGPTNKSTYIEAVECDFVQTGAMLAQIKGSRSNARAPDASSGQQSFNAIATDATNQLVYFREQRRQPRFRFESNVQGGNYEMGDCYAQIRVGDERIVS